MDLHAEGQDGTGHRCWKVSFRLQEERRQMALYSRHVEFGRPPSVERVCPTAEEIVLREALISLCERPRVIGTSAVRDLRARLPVQLRRRLVHSVPDALRVVV